MNHIQHEKAFSASWDGIERFYTSLIATYDGWQWLTPLVALIHDLRERGYDDIFRAGQSMWMFTLSRSHMHHLRPEQHFVVIHPQQDGRMVVEYHTDDRTISTEVAYTTYCRVLEQQLSELAKQVID